jgi:uncharacterized membrane protein
MDIFTGILYMSITLLVEYQIFTLILITIIIYHSVKSEWRTLTKVILSYLAAIALVIGLPYGLIKSMHPEQAQGAEQKVLKEVQNWIS